jgi:hypothetical protein
MLISLLISVENFLEGFISLRLQFAPPVKRTLVEQAT